MNTTGIIDNSTMEDFITEVEKFGLNKEDFDLNETDLTNWIPNAIVPIQGTVTVRRKSNGVEKTYSAGHGHDWIGKFTLDLRRGFYS